MSEHAPPCECEIELVGGLRARVDGFNLERLSKYRWYAHKPKGSLTTYAKTIGSQGRRTVYMHRLVLTTPRGMVTDHIDRNGLNNTRTNLRIVTPAENAASWQHSLQWAAFEAGRSGMSWDDFLERERARTALELENCKRFYTGL